MEHFMKTLSISRQQRSTKLLLVVKIGVTCPKHVNIWYALVLFVVKEGLYDGSNSGPFLARFHFCLQHKDI